MLQKQYHLLRDEAFQEFDNKMSDLDLRPLFSKHDIDQEKKRVKQLKKVIAEFRNGRWYYYFAGVSTGALIAIVWAVIRNQ